MSVALEASLGHQTFFISALQPIARNVRGNQREIGRIGEWWIYEPHG
jgi:hypothetical protein